MSLGFDASRLSNVEASHGTNHTGHGAQKSHEGGINVGALIGIIGQLLTIITAIILIVVALLHRAQFHKLLLIWLGWAVFGVVTITVALIVRVVVYKTDFIDIFITLVFCAYVIACFWFVMSYYKFLDQMVDREDDNNGGSSNKREFSAIEKSRETDGAV